jgi:cation transporter-like permease
MCKKFLADELKKVFGSSNNIDFPIFPMIKKIFFGLVLYGIVMLITFGMTAGLTAMHFFTLSVIFGFLLAVEISVLFTVCSIFVCLIFAYYIAFFVRKGWNRPLN